MLRSSDGKSKKWKGLFVESFCDGVFTLGSLDWIWRGDAVRSSEVLEEDRVKQLESKD